MFVISFKLLKILKIFIIFFHPVSMPKVGSTILLHLFLSLESHNTSKLLSVANKRIIGRLIHGNSSVGHLKANLDQCTRDESGKQVAKIVFVRDPLDRIVSAWRDKFGPIGFAASTTVKRLYYVIIFITESLASIFFLIFYFRRLKAKGYN